MNHTIVSAITLLALTSSPVAHAQSPTCPFGPNWEQIGVYALVMERPAIGDTQIVAPGGPVEEKTVLARRTISLQPKAAYLAADAILSGPDAEKLGQAIPLSKGSLITRWQMGSQSRDCSIGWKNGLFGGAAGEGHYRWICFDDRDGDGAYDAAYRTQSKNMGLSYSQLNIPLIAPVRVEASGAAAARPKNTAALGGRDIEQLLTVRKVKEDYVRLRLEGVSRRDRSEVDVPNAVGKSATIGGFTVTVLSTEGKRVILETVGRFDDPQIEPVCDGTFYAVDGLSAQVNFSFPNW